MMTRKDCADTPATSAAAFLALALLVPRRAAPAEAQPNLGSLMRQKLDRAQQLFEAVVLARFPAVGRHAGELLRISEESTWMAAPTTAYVQQSGGVPGGGDETCGRRRTRATWKRSRRRT